jgi:hypothetical protein
VSSSPVRRRTRLLDARWAPVAAGLLLGLLALSLLVPFTRVDPPRDLTFSEAPFTDEGFNLGNARNRVLFGRFSDDDVDRSLTNGVYSGVAAVVFALTEPHLAAGRAVSMVSVAVAAFLLVAGLAGPLGPLAAWLAGASLLGAGLLLAYGRLGLVEPLLVALLTGAFVLAARTPTRPSVAAGVGLGLLLAAAVSVKAIAVVPAAVMVGVVLLGALVRRRRAELRTGLAAVAAFALAAAAWAALVARPNADRLRIALRIWPRVHYPSTPSGLASRLAEYVGGGSDQAIPRSAVLLGAAAVGLVALVVRWRRLPDGQAQAAVIGLLWGTGLWLAVAVGDYTPNRYIVPALPGLAVAAGFGLASVARLAGRVTVPAALLLSLAVAAPGVSGYLDEARRCTRWREADQRVLAAELPPGAVVYGGYAPTLLFDTRIRTITPWQQADANIDDPVRRFGVTYLLVATTGDQTASVPAFHDRRSMALLARVRWGRRLVLLYRLPRGPAGLGPAGPATTAARRVAASATTR